jgi:hypothetical protein
MLSLDLADNPAFFRRRGKDLGTLGSYEHSILNTDAAEPSQIDAGLHRDHRT